jgi:hypothetical protein
MKQELIQNYIQSESRKIQSFLLVLAHHLTILGQRCTEQLEAAIELPIGLAL